MSDSEHTQPLSETPATAKPTAPRPRRRRWAKWTVAIAAALLAALYGLVPLVAAPILRGKLQRMVDSQLNARLELKRVVYVFPYGLRVSEVKLVTDAPDGARLELLDIPTLEIALAKLPFGEGPLVIRKLILHDPAVRLINTDDGLIGRRRLTKQEPAASSSGAEAQARPSDMFELRRVRIANGSIVYDDRTDRDALPLLWKNINADLGTRPTTNPLYQFRLRADNVPIASADVAGTFDIDRLHLAIDRLRITVESNPRAMESPAPAELQRFIARNDLYGKLSVDGRGSLDVKNMSAAQFDATIALAENPGSGAALVLRCSTGPLNDAQRALASLQRTAAIASTWPTTAPVGSTPTLYVLAENGGKTFGGSTVELYGASAVFNWDAGRWDLHDLRGRLLLGEDKRALPKFLRVAVEGPRFIGAIDVAASGGAELVRGADGRRNYRFDVHATSPDLLATDRRLRFTDVVCDFAVTPGDVSFLRDDKNEGIRATAYGGQVAAQGRITTRKPVAYEFTGAARSLNLASLGRDWADGNGQSPKFSGSGSIEMRFAGSAARDGKRASETFVAEGHVEIVEGDFYEFPILRDIVAAVAPSRDAATVGQAAGVFDVADRKIRFSKAAVSAPLLGLQGSGVATFDGDLDFHTVAAPLSDWKKQLQKTDIPIIGDIGAELLGGIQKLLNTASGKLLYALRIEGTAKQPKVIPEPVPVLTEDALKVFAHMLHGKKEDRLLERIRSKPAGR